MKYKLLRKTSKFSKTEEIQEDLGLSSGLTLLKYSNSNSEGYYWLLPEEILE